MPTIKLLNPDIAAAISAGEVVERPLSVVKELVENSIDADADRIEITIEDGGKQYIEVKDSGNGMDREDVTLCLLKHATSKISKKEDLFNIKTMGFRGEALFSISQVSNFSITTRRKEEMMGTKLTAAGGKVISIHEEGAPFGTTVEVTNLFFNMPARKKFLKSSAWEKSLITEFVEQIAITHPFISFIYKADGKDVFVLPKATNTEERILQLFPELFGKLSSSVAKEQAYSGNIFVSLPDVELSNFYLFSVNKRVVKDKIFFRVINDIFSGQRKRSPFVFADITIPEHEIDVNVHPSKKEVKFRDNTRVYNLLRQLFENTSKSPVDMYVSEDKTASFLEKSDVNAKASINFFNPTALQHQEQSFSNAVNEAKINYEINKNNLNFRIIGTFSKGFILLEKDNRLLIIDQHAAHERIIFNRLIAAYEAKTLTPQMIIPFAFSVKISKQDIIKENKDALERLGFQFDQIGPQNYVLLSLPPNISYNTGVNAFLELIENKEIFKSLKDIAYSTFASIACKEAVKKSEALSEDEISSLINEIHTNSLESYCPHGRNFILEITIEDLEKKFGRKD